MLFTSHIRANETVQCNLLPTIVASVVPSVLSPAILATSPSSSAWICIESHPVVGLCLIGLLSFRDGTERTRFGGFCVNRMLHAEASLTPSSMWPYGTVIVERLSEGGIYKCNPKMLYKTAPIQVRARLESSARGVSRRVYMQEALS